MFVSVCIFGYLFVFVAHAFECLLVRLSRACVCWFVCLIVCVLRLFVHVFCDFVFESLRVCVFTCLRS